MAHQLGYCPHCKSRLAEFDRIYMLRTGVCSYCVTNDAKFRQKFLDAERAELLNLQKKKARSK